MYDFYKEKTKIQLNVYKKMKLKNFHSIAKDRLESFSIDDVFMS